MIKRAICIDGDTRRKKKKRRDFRTRRILSGVLKARTIVGPPSSRDKRLEFETSRDPHKEQERAARQSYGKQKHGRAVHYNTTSARAHSTAPKLLLCNSARAPLIYSFLHNRVSSPNTNIHSIVCPPRKIVIIGRIRDNNTYVLCIAVRESSRLRRARMTLTYFAVTFAFK